jgi:diguanylate cyclase (GGDEF)-like protein
MDRTPSLPDTALKQMVDAALAAPAAVREWPAPLRAAWDAEREPKVRQELSFQLRLGSLVAVGALLIDLLAVPHMALDALYLRLATIVPLNLLGMLALRRGSVQIAKSFGALTLALFGASAVWVSSFAGSDVIARYSMATVLLLGVSLHVLPFTQIEKVRFALAFCLATFLAGLGPHPLPPELLLQHMMLTVLTGGGTLVLSRRLSQLEARDFLRSLQDRFVREELERSNALLRELSESDPLTGLANRRTFERAFEECHTRAGDGTMAVMMIDLDHFKAFNDRHGHQAGDRCLVEVARELDRVVQAYGGHLARFGGEEFVVLLPETGKCFCVMVAEEMREKLATLAIPVGQGASAGITASFGIARARGERVLGEMLARADEALYRAKQMGRNRVEVAFAAAEQLH